MNNISRTRLFTMYLIYLGITFLILFFQLIPLNLFPEAWVGPDILLGVTHAWVTRQPDFVPILLVTVSFLLADFLLQRPPGLFALLVVIGTEYIKSHVNGLRYASFIEEWITAGFAITFIIVAFWCVQAVVGIGQAPFTMSLLHIVATIITYPAILLGSHIFFGIRKSPSHSDDSMGRRS